MSLKYLYTLNIELNRKTIYIKIYYYNNDNMLIRRKNIPTH